MSYFGCESAYNKFCEYKTRIGLGLDFLNFLNFKIIFPTILIMK